MQGVFNPNILIYHPPNSAEGLHFSAFHYKCAASSRSRQGLGAEVNGAGPSAMVVEKNVVGPSAMVVESDSVGPSPMVTEVGRYAQSSWPDGQLSQHI